MNEMVLVGLALLCPNLAKQ